MNTKHILIFFMVPFDIYINPIPQKSYHLFYTFRSISDKVFSSFYLRKRPKKFLIAVKMGRNTTYLVAQGHRLRVLNFAV